MLNNVKIMNGQETASLITGMEKNYYISLYTDKKQNIMSTKIMFEMNVSDFGSFVQKVRSLDDATAAAVVSLFALTAKGSSITFLNLPGLSTPLGIGSTIGSCHKKLGAI